MSGLLYLLDVYEALMGASAVAATSLLRYVLAAAFPLFINDSMWSNTPEIQLETMLTDNQCIRI